MCFSATASFTVAALLLPASVFSYWQAQKYDKNLRHLALIPLVFSIQQFIEGLLWLTQTTDINISGHLFALGFLFFSHLFWLIWIPYACFNIETDPYRKKLFVVFTIAGAIHGSLMYIPLLFNPDWLSYHIYNNSIGYHTTFFYDALIPNDIVRLLYAIIVLFPLFFSSEKSARTFGIVISISLFGAAALYMNTFVSVWCYFAAVISLYIVINTAQLKPQSTPIS